jgi:hypothetical protein
VGAAGGVPRAGPRRGLSAGPQRRPVIIATISSPLVSALRHTHLLAAAEDADAVGEAKDLIERVADEQDRPAPVAHPSDQLLHAPRLHHAERGGGLVHQHQPLRPEHGARARHARPLPAGEVPDRLGGALDAHVELVEQHRCLDRHGVAVEPPQRPLHELAAEEHVHVHGLGACEGEVLEHDLDPLSARVERTGEVDRLTLE